MFNVCLCARFQKESREVHLKAVKHIFIYLIGTSNLSLMFKRRKILDIQSTVMLTMLVTKLKQKTQVEVVTLSVAT